MFIGFITEEKVSSYNEFNEKNSKKILDYARENDVDLGQAIYDLMNDVEYYSNVIEKEDLEISSYHIEEDNQFYEEDDVKLLLDILTDKKLTIQDAIKLLNKKEE